MKFDSAKSVVEHLYLLSNDTKTLVPWKRGLRPSGFPYCGVRDLYDILQGGRMVERGFGLDYYGGVGTAAHKVFQKYMGLTGVVVGNWKCACGKTKKWSTESICVCGLQMEYEEVGILNGSIRGFIDCILLIDNKYYILDYKTSSTKKLLEHRLKSGVYPTSANKSQVLSYCANVERQYNVPISGWMLMYIARDNPRDFVVVGEAFDSSSRLQQKQLMVRYNRHYSIASRLSKDFDTGDEGFLSLIEEKPCATYEKYRENFGDFGDCPLGNSHVCFNKSRLKRIIEEST
jgi:PD-(D/E)XK nuclease superfamily